MFYCSIQHPLGGFLVPSWDLRKAIPQESIFCCTDGTVMGLILHYRHSLVIGEHRLLKESFSIHAEGLMGAIKAEPERRLFYDLGLPVRAYVFLFLHEGICGTNGWKPGITQLFAKLLHKIFRQIHLDISCIKWPDLQLLQLRDLSLSHSMLQRPTPNTICHEAVSKPVHLAKTCTAERDQRSILWREPTGGGGEGWLTQPGKTVLFTGPDTQSRNAFKQSKERKRKSKRKKERGKRGGRKGREKGEEEEWKQGEICASLWETVLVLIYTSMVRAQNELWEQNNNRNQEIKERLKPVWLKEEWRRRAAGCYSLRPKQ